MESKYLPTTHYIVATSYSIELPGPDKRYVEILGSYESLQDAKRAVEENVDLIMDNDKQCLTIYKVNLEDGKVHDFYRSDLPEPMKRAVQKQQMLRLQKIATGKPYVPQVLAEIAPPFDGGPLKAPKKGGNFPRPMPSPQMLSATIESSPPQPLALDTPPIRKGIQ